MEVGHVVIQIRLADLGVGSEDVHDKGVEIDCIGTFGGILKNSIVDIVNCYCKLVTCEGEDHLVGVPCLTALVACSSLHLVVVVPAGATDQARGSIIGMLNASPLHAR
jgi:hypothetical protein